MTSEHPSPDIPRPPRSAEAILLRGVVRRFGEVTALDQVDLAVCAGEFFSLLGPSGCGKTTLLRIVAGLDHPDAGSVFIGGRDMEQVPPHKRPVNTVFQSYALFPHMTVWDNIAFGLRMKGMARDEQRDRVGRVMEMVQIQELRHRRPHQLSGGQKQRVALARAIVNEPQVLLLDEPLGALDLRLRKQLQTELHDLQKRLGITFLYVTHDQDEALAMSDRIAVMNHGRIEQLGDSEFIYEHPRTRYVAQFLGSCNLIEGRVERQNGRHLTVQTPFGPLQVTARSNGVTPASGKTCTLAIRPEKLQVDPVNGQTPPNTLRATVNDHVYSGAEIQYVLRAQDWQFRTCALNSSAAPCRFKRGDQVSVSLPPDALILLED